ncbi:MAG: MBL fold metallo-hydrolase [Spirochaetes bacterium]|nr:MBL fold metallo-hydrolase [Spirochaetota bacterium]
MKKVRGNNNVTITWLGTAGVHLSDGDTSLLIDPYVSRFGMLRVGLGLPLRADQDLIRQWAGRLGSDNIGAVLVSHSHFDHSVDAPFFALHAGAPLIGSESTLNVGRGAGLPEKLLKPAMPGRQFRVGSFSITFIESGHGPVLFNRVPYPGTIDSPLALPARAAAYRLGGVYGILVKHPSGTILHHGSAGFIPGMYERTRADVLLLGIAGRGNTERYLNEVALKIAPQILIPVHHDNFFKPMEKGFYPLGNARIDEFIRTAAKHASLTITLLPFARQVSILPLNPAFSSARADGTSRRPS